MSPDKRWNLMLSAGALLACLVALWLQSFGTVGRIGGLVLVITFGVITYPRLKRRAFDPDRVAHPLKLR